MLKKIILTLLSALILFHGSMSPVLAQTTTAKWYDTGPFDWYKKVYSQDISPASEIFGERYTAAQVQWVLYSLIAVPLNLLFSSEFIGCVISTLPVNVPGPVNISSICGLYLIPLVQRRYELFIDLVSSVDNNTYFATTDSSDNNLLSLVFKDKTLSGLTYTKNFLNKINLVPEVHAQDGFGFGALEILQNMWVVSRNFAYGLLIFAAIIMAIMIMLRSKISPQAVITAQSAIPKLVGAIILITFSYAIAGFMVDLVYVVIGIVSGILAPLGNVDPTVIYTTLTDGPGGWGILGLLWFYVLVFPFILSANVFGPPDISTILIEPFIALIIFLVLVILIIIFAIAVLRIFFMMIRALVNVYLLTIFGPFYILGGTVTQSLGFGAWIRGLLQNLLVFPAVGIMYYFALLFLAFSVNATSLPGGVNTQFTDMLTRLGATVDPGNSAGWAPPLLGFGNAPNAGLIMSIVSVSIVFMIPRTADIIAGFFSGRPFALGTAIGETLAPMATGARAGGQYMSSTQQAGYAARVRTPFGNTPRQERSNAIYDALGRIGWWKR